MAVPNKKRVETYHRKLNTIRVRVPSPDEEHNIPDYVQMIRDRAKELGFINQRGIDKGQGSANAYILHLIEQDMKIDMIKSMGDLKDNK